MTNETHHILRLFTLRQTSCQADILFSFCSAPRPVAFHPHLSHPNMKYRKLKRHEIIEKDDLHRLKGFKEKETIKHPETVGQTPSDFHKFRYFFRPIK